jgi:uncharacterized protein
MQYKTLPFATQTTADFSFAGYAAAFGNVDRTGEVILPGAFTRTLPEFLKSGLIAWQHDWSTPIGKPTTAHEDATGLYLEAKISDTTAGRDALTLLRDGVISKMSIGYAVKGYRVLSEDEGRLLLGAGYDAAVRDLPPWADGIRALTDIDLYEASPVSVPANNRADITAVKEWLQADHSNADHYEAALAVVTGFVKRAQAIADAREKDGRTLSAATRTKLAGLQDSLTACAGLLKELLDATEPKAAPATILAEWVRFEEHMARAHGALT